MNKGFLETDAIAAVCILGGCVLLTSLYAVRDSSVEESILSMIAETENNYTQSLQSIPGCVIQICEEENAESYWNAS